ncbi:hypothetical protein P692DRAFT_20915657 [Suillus brevipes Sb2]|nr:hypothetical protein P692DRAFT_20915657 [Suillus brevipes Sb2]
MPKEHYPQYHPVNNNITILKPLDGTEIRHQLKSRFFQPWPWLSHVLMSTTMVFLILWARAPSIDDAVMYSPANEAIEFMGIIRFDASLCASSSPSQNSMQLGMA